MKQKYIYLKNSIIIWILSFVVLLCLCYSSKNTYVHRVELNFSCEEGYIEGVKNMLSNYLSIPNWRFLKTDYKITGIHTSNNITVDLMFNDSVIYVLNHKKIIDSVIVSSVNLNMIPIECIGLKNTYNKLVKTMTFHDSINKGFLHIFVQDFLDEKEYQRVAFFRGYDKYELYHIQYASGNSSISFATSLSSNQKVPIYSTNYFKYTTK